MITHEIVGGWAHQCNCCDKADGRLTLYWKKEDFDLCHECLRRLFFEHIMPEIKLSEEIICTRIAISEKTRARVFERDGHKCVACGSQTDLQLDHKKPFTLGGGTTEENLQTMCKECNNKKGKKWIEL